MAKNDIIKNITIDCIVYSFQNNNLNILLVKHAIGESKGEWGLPGGFVNCDESVDNAASRTLKHHTGLDDVYLEQLRVFGDIDRYPYSRVITIAYFALVKYTNIDIKAGASVFNVKWFPIEDHPKLIFDHQAILNFGRQRLQHIVRHEPIGFKLLPPKFTLLQLQYLYEAILNTQFDKPNFRRKLLKMKLLINTGKKQENVSHRAANLYQFDLKMYVKLRLSGFTFDL